MLIPSQKPVTPSFDVFFDLRLNKRLSKQLSRRWFVTPLRSLRRHCNELLIAMQCKKVVFYHPIKILSESIAK